MVDCCRGDGLWSKSEKEATISLVRYSTSFNETDYNNFAKFIKVPLGDKQARLELNKSHPNPTIVMQGFVAGLNSPSDVNNMTFLYRRFRKESYMKSAIQIWQQGDAYIVKLISVGDQLHNAIAKPINQSNPKLVAARATTIADLAQQTYKIDTSLTNLENQFSSTLGQGSRSISSTLLLLIIITTGLLGVLTVIISIIVSKAIVRIDKAKSEFVSLASHQLRTPLTAINWYVELLLSDKTGALNDLQRKYLSQLYESGQRMSSLISDVLDVSRLELGTYLSEDKEVKVIEILNSTIAELQPQLNKKKITVEQAVQPELPSMYIDQRLLNVVFQNLLSNSVKYTPENGNIKVVISLKKNFIIICVQDNGMGIPKDQQPQIFLKLFRANNAKEQDSQGTGLGLYIVKAMVERVGGSIHFDSVENQGTTFIVKLPTNSKKAAKFRNQKS